MRAIILLLLATIPAWATYANGYSYRRTVTVQPAQVPSTQTNFPMVVSGTYAGSGGTADLRTAANGGKVAGVCNQTTIIISVACDVIFTSDAAGSTTLKFEWESYSATTGTLSVWINVPSISNGTVIYLFYGKASVTTFQGNVTGTWDSSYKGVWHLAEASNAQALDSTNVNNSTSNTATQVVAQVGNGQSFVSASSQEIDIAAISSLSSATKASLSAWFKRTSASNAVYWGQDAGTGSRFAVEVFTDGKIYCVAESSGGSFGSFASNDTAWHKLDMVFDGSQSGNAARLVAYLDGVAQTLTFAGTIPSTLNSAARTFYFGNAPSTGHSNGSIDEGRLTVGATRSADWIVASYNNQLAPSSFYALGAETLAGLGAAIIMQ